MTIVNNNNSNDTNNNNNDHVIVGVVYLLLALICCGTWPAILRLSSCRRSTITCSYDHHNYNNYNNDNDNHNNNDNDNDNNNINDNNTSNNDNKVNECWILQLFGQHRHPCHAYLDYSLSYTLVSILIPAILLLASLHIQNASNKEQNSNYDNYNGTPNSNTSSSGIYKLLVAAVMGGTLLSLGNLSMQWATTVFHAPLTTVLAMQASITVVLGTSLNYIIDPTKTSRPKLLAIGVSSFLCAIYFSIKSQLLYTSHQSQTVAHNDSYTRNPIGYLSNSHHGRYKYLPSSYIGIVIALMGGICFGFFSPLFNIAVNDPFQWSSSSSTNHSGGLNVPLANACFGLAFGFSSILWNIHLMNNYPFQISDAHVPNNANDPNIRSPPSSLQTYLHSTTFKDRATALMAGILCSTGNILQFKGGSIVGFAASDLVQAYPIIATLWDILIFAEFQNHLHLSVLICLSVMYITYLTGIVFITSSI